MLTIGIVFCAMGVLHGGIKYYVIRNAARDVYNGGGVPVLDFVIFVPLWLTVGSSHLLAHYHIHPFLFFGLALYIVIAAVLFGIMELEYRLGKPEIDRQLADIQKRKEAEQTSAGDVAKSAAPEK